MKEKSFSIVFLSVLLFSMMSKTLFLVSVKTDPKTISVPQDYPTIQDAVNAASVGDAILVASGTYHENVVIGISVTLAGAGDDTTYIHGDRTEAGIEILAGNVKISGFTILDCEDGIKISSNGTTVIDNTITSNIFAGIYVEFSDGNTLSGNTIVSNDFVGVYLKASSKNKISGNKIANNNDTGMYLKGQSSSNSISNNTITSNRYYGISLSNSGNNVITDNLISNNDTGIGLVGSSGNVIAGNTILGNKYYGIDLFESDGNTFYHNNFFDNQYHVESAETTNAWDNGAEGNYWNDFIGEDLNGDGIGDTPYGGIDKYPLMDPWSSIRAFNITSDGNIYIVTVFSNSTIASFDFNQSLEQISFNVTGPSDTLGFCNVTIPKNPMNREPSQVWTVTVNNTYTTFTLMENSTHTSLQFTYSHSIRNVQIRVIEIPNVPPKADFTFSPIDPVLYDTIDFIDTSTDSDGEIASWFWEFGDGNSSTDQNPRYKYANAGEYVVTLTVEDNLGAKTVTSKVASVRKVETAITLDTPSTVIQGDPFTMTVILKDEYENSLPHATIEFYLFEAEEWKNIDSVETDNNGIASIPYASPQVAGTHRFKARFPGTQIFAESSIIFTIEIIAIIDVNLPEANAGPDRNVHVGVPVIFNASGSSDNVGIVSYEWDFGDGTTGTGVIVTHTYTESGTYTVTLTVKDEAGNSDTDLVKVIVEAESSFPIWIVIVIVTAGIITVVGLFLRVRKRN